ncbi:MAG TPA: tail fiber protein [Saprospiraceae bacterium]|nr:tail fiber protein [Saprospiraceae bacterium]HPN69421.1 tail fiber protein [Saprospiraceae bacterium]
MEPFIAQIIVFGGNFAIRGYAMCNGQILSIAQNTALFSLVGTTYGGNGQTTFALPDLRGRVAMHWGQGPGLSPYNLGQVAGNESTTLLSTNLPPTSVSIPASTNAANSDEPSGSVIATTGGNLYNSTANAFLQPGTLQGGSQPFNNIQPYLCLTHLIALEGIFPSRN